MRVLWSGGEAFRYIIGMSGLRVRAQEKRAPIVGGGRDEKGKRGSPLSTIPILGCEVTPPHSLDRVASPRSKGGEETRTQK
jgi:hypothetical protein